MKQTDNALPFENLKNGLDIISRWNEIDKRYKNTMTEKKVIKTAINLDDLSVNHVVSSMSARDRKILEELVRDSMLYGNLIKIHDLGLLNRFVEDLLLLSDLHPRKPISTILITI